MPFRRPICAVLQRNPALGVNRRGRGRILVEYLQAAGRPQGMGQEGRGLACVMKNMYGFLQAVRDKNAIFAWDKLHSAI